MTLNTYLHYCERLYLCALLQRHGGRVDLAAKEAGRNRCRMYHMMKRHGLDPDAFREKPVVGIG